MKQIILTGGGTAGHVTPNIALLPSLAAAGYQVTYIQGYQNEKEEITAKYVAEQSAGCYVKKA